MKKIKLDPEKVEWTGSGFKAVIKDEDKFWKNLKKLQKKITKDIKNKNKQK